MSTTRYPQYRKAVDHPLDLDDLIEQIWAKFDRDALARVCAMDEEEFEAYYQMDRYAVDQPAPDDFFLFRSAGSEGGEDSSILAVAHLDTVARANPHERRAQFLDTEGGTVVYSRALDDRLGAYIILELLPDLGLMFDVLLTVGEESGRSTAQFFGVDPGKYNWMIEFDRGGSDVVMYQYEDKDTADLVRATGARVEDGIFSDISFLDHLGIKGFNWGVGYQDYHGPKAHAWLDDTFKMLAYFLRFHHTNADVVLTHTPDPKDNWWGGGRSSGGRAHDPDKEECDFRGDRIECGGEVDDHVDYGRVCEDHLTWIEEI